MKPILFLALLLPISLHAQDTTTLRKSIGVFTEWNGPGNNGTDATMSTVGLVYKRMTNEYIHYTFTAGYSNYITNSPYGTKMILFNTSSEWSMKKNVKMAIIGFGVEGQRRFYKKVYFTCGMELRTGYGTGTADTMLHMETYIVASSSGAPVGKLNVADIYVGGSPCNTFLMGVAPNIGAKMEFKRFTLGTMLLNYIRFEMNSVNKSSTVDFNSSNIYQRLFVTYKF